MAYERQQELELALKNDDFSLFLDAITSPEEFAAVRKIAEPQLRGRFKTITDCDQYFNFFEQSIKKYHHHPFSPGSVHGNLVYQKIIEKPYGKIIYLRFLEFCNYPWRGGIDEIAQYILLKEYSGEKIIQIDYYHHSFDSECLSRLSYYTQIQARSIRRLIFPHLVQSGIKNSFYFFEFK